MQAGSFDISDSHPCHQGILIRPLTKEEKALLSEIERSPDARRVKEIESETKHDVKACEYWLRERFSGTSLADLVPMLHFGLTSNDVTDTAYALMVRSGLREALLPAALELRATLASLAKEHAGAAMLGHTHGQPASPTTLGKEFAVFSTRLERQLTFLKEWKPTSKLSGATGTYAAQHVAAPEVDWPSFAEKFLGSLGLSMTALTTQIDPKDSFAELFHTLERANSICIDLCRDCWLYISMGYLRQKVKAGEVGSSTMPHKVNPIHFENAEGNLELANSLLSFMAGKLAKSRLQRDLSDSTVLRNIGVAFGHTLLGWKSIIEGLSRISPDMERLSSDLDAHPEVLSEAIQTVMRRHGAPEAYEQLKALSRGKALSLEELRTFISTLALPEKDKKRLLSLEPATYTGLAETLAKSDGKRR